MRRLVIVGILALALMGTVGATALYFHYHPGQASVKTTELTEYLDGVIMGNGTTFSYGDVEPGEAYTHNYTVVNSGATVVSVSLRIENLPSGWGLTWAGNNTALNPGQAVIGDLILTVGSGAGDGTYYWDHYLEAIK